MNLPTTSFSRCLLAITICLCFSLACRGQQFMLEELLPGTDIVEDSNNPYRGVAHLPVVLDELRGTGIHWSIGVSDPGMSPQMGYVQALFRAKLMLSWLISNQSGLVSEIFSKDSEQSYQGKEQFRECFRLQSSLARWPSGLVVMDSTRLQTTETVVVIKCVDGKADFSERPSSLVYWFFKQQKQMGYVSKGKYSLFSILRQQSDTLKEEYDVYFSGHRKCVYSSWQKDREGCFTPAFYDYFLPVGEGKTVYIRFNYGLWTELVQAFLQEVYNLSSNKAVMVSGVDDEYDQNQRVSINRLSHKFNSSLVIDSLGIKEHRLRIYLSDYGN